MLHLETRTIIYGGDLRAPNSYLQMVTFGQSDFLVGFANPGAVAKEDMVIWNPANSTWNQNFPAVPGSTWPERFGATLVSKEMICPAN